MAVLETYTIGKGIIDSEDTRNVLLDSETIVAIAEPSASHYRFSIDARRVSAFAVVTDVSLYDAIDSDFVQGVAIALASQDAENVVSDTVVGTAVIFSNLFYDGETVIGQGVLSADEDPKGLIIGTAVVSGLDEIVYIVIGKANIYEGVQDVSSTVVGLGDLNWPASGGKDIYRPIDRDTVVGLGELSVQKEGGNFFLNSNIYPHTNSGAPGASALILDESALDNPSITLGEKFILNTDTVDSSTVTGEGIARSTFDESGTTVGIAEIYAILSEGYADEAVVG